MPIFSINGNHDDPNGKKYLCNNFEQSKSNFNLMQFKGRRGKSALDLFQTINYVNYYGKCTNLNEVHIKPILMSKGTQKLALYGLSHIPDKRLVKLLLEKKVIIDRPNDEDGKFFNIFTLHQNRAGNRGADNYIKENYLPDFMDFIFWGHEHDYEWKPEEIGGNKFSLLQLGSSVATSLSEGESKQKFIGLLEISNDTFQYTPIKLETVRPMIFKTIDLRDESCLNVDSVDEKKQVCSNILNHCEHLLKQYFCIP